MTASVGLPGPALYSPLPTISTDIFTPQDLKTVSVKWPLEKISIDGKEVSLVTKYDGGSYYGFEDIKIDLEGNEFEPDNGDTKSDLIPTGKQYVWGADGIAKKQDVKGQVVQLRDTTFDIPGTDLKEVKFTLKEESRKSNLGHATYTGKASGCSLTISQELDGTYRSVLEVPASNTGDANAPRGSYIYTNEADDAARVVANWTASERIEITTTSTTESFFDKVVEKIRVGSTTQEEIVYKLVEKNSAGKIINVTLITEEEAKNIASGSQNASDGTSGSTLSQPPPAGATPVIEEVNQNSGAASGADKSQNTPQNTPFPEKKAGEKAGEAGTGESSPTPSASPSRSRSPSPEPQVTTTAKVECIYKKITKNADGELSEVDISEGEVEECRKNGSLKTYYKRILVNKNNQEYGVEINEEEARNLIPDHFNSFEKSPFTSPSRTPPPERQETVIVTKSEVVAPVLVKSRWTRLAPICMIAAALVVITSSAGILTGAASLMEVITLGYSINAVWLMVGSATVGVVASTLLSLIARRFRGAERLVNKPVASAEVETVG